MNLKYSNACKEVLVLFDYFLDENDLSKIPEEQIQYMRKNANDQYNYVINETKELEDQNISKEAKAMIISLYKKYFATSEQRKKVDEIITILNRQRNNNLNKNSFNNSIENDNSSLAEKSIKQVENETNNESFTNMESKIISENTTANEEIISNEKLENTESSESTLTSENTISNMNLLVKKESIWKKVINKILNFFHIKK